MKSFTALALPWVLLGPFHALAGDCNGNGIDDAADLLPGALRLGSPRTFPLDEPPADIVVEDLDGDGLGDVAAARAFGVSILMNRGEGQLESVRGLTIGSNPIAVRAADLDGNGAMDLVTGNVLQGSLLTGNISVMMNRGGGDFAIARNFSVNHSPVSILCADLDGDGSQDVAAATVQPGIYVLWNRGAGRFEGEVVHDVTLPGSPVALAAGDLDGDGDSDLVCMLSEFAGRILVLRTLGGGSFEAIAQGEDLPGAYPLAISLADLDGDRDLDLVTSTRFVARPHEGELVVSRNDGHGTFSAPTPLGPGVFPAVVTADVDADGSPEVITASRDGRLALWRSPAGGDVSVREIHISGDSAALAAGDIDGDGAPDLLAGGPGQLRITLLTNDGRGGFLETIRLDADGPATPVDMDGDGDLDLLTTRAGSVLLLANQGELELEERLSQSEGARRGGAVATDLDGDGDLDAVVSSSRKDFFSHGVAVLLNQGGGDLGPSQPYAHGLDVRKIQPEDIDHDGDMDLVLDAQARPSVFVLPNNGSGAFDSPVEVSMARGGAIDSMLADLDQDGSRDLVAVTLEAAGAAGPALVVRLNQSGGGFADATSYPLSRRPGLPLPADWNRDGHVDLALPVSGCAGCPSAEPGTILLFLGRGDGTFYVEPLVEIPHLPESFLAADLDGDGLTDMAAAFGERGKVLLFRASGSGAFGPPLEIDLPVSPLGLEVFDIDGDGDLDLATINRAPDVALEVCPDCEQSAGNALTVVRNLGGMRFSAPIHHAAVEGGESLRAADLDGDGLPELTLADSSGSLVLLGNFTDPPASVDRDRDAVPDECEARFHRGDSNGDGVLGIADAIHLLSHLFLSAPSPGCLESADADDDGAVKLTDGVFILAHLYLSGPSPAPPGPPGIDCGPDPGAPGGPGDLGCEAYPGCAP